jgi:AbrB family looped-hinge helix DNA binding protein
MTSKTVVKITNRGMVSIPAAFRKKYDLKDGNYVIVIEEEGTLRLIPLKSTEQLQEESIPAEEMLKIIAESRKEELELER